MKCLKYKNLYGQMCHFHQYAISTLVQARFGETLLDLFEFCRCRSGTFAEVHVSMARDVGRVNLGGVKGSCFCQKVYVLHQCLHYVCIYVVEDNASYHFCCAHIFSAHITVEANIGRCSRGRPQDQEGARLLRAEGGACTDHDMTHIGYNINTSGRINTLHTTITIT